VLMGMSLTLWIGLFVMQPSVTKTSDVARAAANVAIRIAVLLFSY